MSLLGRHLVKGRACSWFLQDNPRKMIAVARYYGRRVWLLRVPGHEWDVTPEMNVSRFLSIPGNGMKKVTVRAFPSVSACENEVKHILKTKNVLV